MFCFFHNKKLNMEKEAKERADSLERKKQNDFYNNEKLRIMGESAYKAKLAEAEFDKAHAGVVREEGEAKRKEIEENGKIEIRKAEIEKEKEKDELLFKKEMTIVQNEKEIRLNEIENAKEIKKIELDQANKKLDAEIKNEMIKTENEFKLKNLEIENAHKESELQIQNERLKDQEAHEEDPLSKGIIKRVKKIVGGDWVVFACVNGLKGYDLSISTYDDDKLISYYVDSFKFEVIKIRD